MLNKNSNETCFACFQIQKGKNKKIVNGLTLQTYFISFYIFRHNKNLQLIGTET